MRTAFGRRAGAATGWWFLGGVVIGAPAVALIGGFYVAELLGAGRGAAVAAAAAMIAIVLAANAAGLHTTARLQLGLAGAARARCCSSRSSPRCPHSEAENWTPFAPHGWRAIGGAASVLMFSFVGWEAVSHLAGELKDPARQLPRAIGAALAIVIVLYLGLAVGDDRRAGTAAPSDVPLADLMAAGLGEPGRSDHRAARRPADDGHDEHLRGRGDAPRGRAGAGRQRAACLAARSRARRVRGDLAARCCCAPRARAARRRRADARHERRCSSPSTSRRRRPASGCSPARARVAARVAFVAVLVVFAFSGAYILVPLAILALTGYFARRSISSTVRPSSSSAGQASGPSASRRASKAS